MGFEDRDYYRDGPSVPTNPIARIGHWLWYGRVYLFDVFGIRVQAHPTLLLTMLLTLLLMGNGFQWQDRVMSAGLLFLIVLLHEFGHCWGARHGGGEADEILMHPLGGLALTRPLPTWRAHLLTSASGPAVNVIFCIVCGAVLLAKTGHVPWQPIPIRADPSYGFNGWLDPVWLSYWLYQTNWALLLFNLLPIFPLDGGRITQELMWPKLGYYKSMVIACNVGMVGAVIFGMVAVASGMIGLLILAVLGFMLCFQMKRQLAEIGPYGFGEYDDPFTQVLEQSKRQNRRQRRGIGWADRWNAARTEREAKRAESEEAEVDRILAKVSANGMHSLTRSEQKTLKHASDRKRRTTPR